MTNTNEQLIEEYKELSMKMRKLADENRLNERNSYVPRIHELDKLIDWGYKAGEPVERKTGRGWEEDVILKVEDSKVFFRTVIIPPTLMRRPIKEKHKKQQSEPRREYEQISLF